ncbi:MAG: hypothetical protein M5U12_27190 [Verrucomicrobia bacterium]|nr:hypothetical protein [Verrucomicrobiota bacterium]
MNACRKPDVAVVPRSLGGLLLLPLLLGLTLSAAACRSTHFPDHPQQHRLAEALAAAPDPYYKLLANGVFSRLAGRLPEATTKEWLRQIKEQHWKHLEPLASAQAVVTELRDRGLPPGGRHCPDRAQSPGLATPGNPRSQTRGRRRETGSGRSLLRILPPPTR